jgi:transcriptional regulator with XRE-family HTH domain
MMKTRLRDMREDNDLTQQKVAEYLQCDQSLYSKYEREERDVPLHIMVKLAFFYKTSVDYLVGLTNEKKPYPRSR